MRHDFTLFRRKGQKVWYFHYYDGDRRTTKSTGKTKKYEAEEFAKAFVNLAPQVDVTLREYADSFFVWGECKWIKRQHAKSRPFSESMAKMRRAHFTNYLLPAFGRYKLAEINAVKIEDWLISLPLANQTKKHIQYSLNIILGEAEREGILVMNPVRKVEPLGRKARSRDVFTLDELRALLPTDAQDLLRIWRDWKYVSAFALLATTGIRSGELRALQWRHVIWEGGLVIEQAVKSDGSIGVTKTNRSRVVLMPSRTVELIQMWREITVHNAQEDLIFPGRNPKFPLDKASLLDALRKALRFAEIATDGRNIVVHSFRHTFNTLLRPVLPQSALQAMTGHSTDAMTLHYDHPTSSSQFQTLLPYQQHIDEVFAG